MQLASVLLARVYGLVPIEDLNPRGTVYIPDVAAGLVERYGFQKSPKTLEEFDESKGIEFVSGRLGKTVIDRIVILSSGIYVDTSASTEASEMILQDALNWATGEFGITYRPEMIKRRAYVSQITFHSESPLLAFHPVLEKICAVITRQVQENLGMSLRYDSTGFNLTYDQLTTSSGAAPFTIQRREGVPFEENKYFAVAPLKTDLHIELLKEYEQAMSR